MTSPSVRSLPDRISFIDAAPGGSIHLSFMRGADLTVRLDRIIKIRDTWGEDRLITAGQLLEHDMVLHLY